MKNEVFELGKYKNASIISRACMPHYIRHLHISGGCLISEVLQYIRVGHKSEDHLGQCSIVSDSCV